MRWRAAIMLIAWGVTAGLPAVHPAASVLAGPASKPKPSPIDVTADAITVDAATGVVTATGRVRITGAGTTLMAGRATLQHAERRVVLTDGPKASGSIGALEGTEITILYTTTAIAQIVATGKASLDTREGRLLAPVIVIDPRAEFVSGQGGVSISAPPDVVATGRQVDYHRARGVVVLEGGARVARRDGFIQGERIEAQERIQRAMVTGPVWGRFRDIEVRSRTAEFFGAEKKAVFEGDVSVSQPGRQMTTEKATVWYEARRVVAEGQTRVRLEGQP